LARAEYKKSPVTELKGVGPRIAEHLQKININSVEDVLFHLPYRYEDRSRIIAIGALRSGQAAVFDGVIDHVEVAFTRRGKSRRMLLCHMSDGTGHILLRFFYFNKIQQSKLIKGCRLRCFGEARFGATCLEIIHPEYELLLMKEGDEIHAPAPPDHLTPVYPATEGVQQALLRRMSTQVLSLLNNENILQELIPQNLVDQFGLFSLKQALNYVHRPPIDADLSLLGDGLHASQQRLAFEELLAQHLSLQQLRQKTRQYGAYALQSKVDLVNDFLSALPFDMTAAQARVNNIILQDIEKKHPMMRLVQGDVGSGKTVVAAIACIKAIESCYQAAIMAPTEILAEQHYQNFSAWLKPLGVEVAWLSGKLKGKKREHMLELIASGQAAMIVGTHALFQKEVKFNRLALVVVDEQHRFGVHQRLALREKGERAGYIPHQLIMTATPIPRSLAMTAYADLDYSVIDELPPGRIPVKTVVVPEDRRDEVIARVKNACTQGKQTYWVCTLVEESEFLQCRAAEDTVVQLQQSLPELVIGLVHGRMKADKKAQVMQEFKQGKISLLVATTVIEVGVDVPNASLMIIENAERLGLSQLHQLRGRVGRGGEASHCVLMFKKPLSTHARSRLAVMRETSSGFDIAKKDLQLRGPGEVLGTKQTGLMQLKIADIVRDEPMLDDIKAIAQLMSSHHPDNIKKLIDRWLGGAQQYGNVG
jgi:ATP-dependent DNA helicase RecG